MSKPHAAPRSPCPIGRALDYLGDRWTLLVLRDMLLRDKRQFGDFLAAPEGIATNILSARLKTLEADGFIRREPDPQHGRRVLYRPTARALSLLPLMLELVLWGSREGGADGVPEDFLRRIEGERESVLAELRAKLAAA